MRPKKHITAKEAQEITGWSPSWLRRHECTWCGQDLLRAIQYGCCANSYGPGPIGNEDCQPATKRKPWWKS